MDALKTREPRQNQSQSDSQSVSLADLKPGLQRCRVKTAKCTPIDHRFMIDMDFNRPDGLGYESRRNDEGEFDSPNDRVPPIPH